MTRKQELIQFIEANIDDTKYLYTEEYIITMGRQGFKTYGVAKEKLINRINVSFDDNLIGQLPGDVNQLQILNWTTVPKEQ